MSSKITELSENEKKFLNEMIEIIEVGLEEEDAKNPEEIKRKLLVETGFTYEPDKWGNEAKSLADKNLAELDEIDVGTSHKTVAVKDGEKTGEFGGPNIHKMIKIDEELYKELTK